jgi:hypothetical protein
MALRMHSVFSSKEKVPSSRLRVGQTVMQSNMKLLKVFTVAGVVLFVFLGLYAWHGLRYLVRRASASQHQQHPRETRRPYVSTSSPVGPDFRPEKLAA